MIKVLAIIIGLFPFMALAAPLAETIELPYSDAVIEYEFTVNTDPPQLVSPTDTGTGYRGYLDVAAYAGTGQINITARARNIWGWSALSAPFLSGTSVPGVPNISTLVPAVP